MQDDLRRSTDPVNATGGGRGASDGIFYPHSPAPLPTGAGICYTEQKTTPFPKE